MGGFAWRPDGKSIAFNRQTNPLINSGNSSDIVLIDVATRKMTTLISNPSGDFFQRWSPDGKAFVYGSSLTDSTTNYFKNNHSFIYDMDSRSSLPIGEDIDENKFIADWSRQGLFLGALEKTKQKLSNPAFTEKAPPAVLEEHKKRLIDLESKLAQIHRALEALQ